jgi:hypothetical protein
VVLVVLEPFLLVLLVLTDLLEGSFCLFDVLLSLLPLLVPDQFIDSLDLLLVLLDLGEHGGQLLGLLLEGLQNKVLLLVLLFE